MFYSRETNERNVFLGSISRAAIPFLAYLVCGGIEVLHYSGRYPSEYLWRVFVVVTTPIVAPRTLRTQTVTTQTGITRTCRSGARDNGCHGGVLLGRQASAAGFVEGLPDRLTVVVLPSCSLGDATQSALSGKNSGAVFATGDAAIR